MTKIELLEVDINTLKLAKWDVRRTKEDLEKFESMKNSIRENGLIYPLTVAKMTETGDFIVTAGRRRLRALKELGWNKVPILIQFENITETELRRITLIENLHRRDLVDVEKAFGILAVYEAEGYTGEQVIKGNKSIDNWLSHKDRTWEQLQKEDSSFSSDKPVNPLRSDPKFIEISKKLGNTPKYQYQLLQTVLQLDPDVYTQAQEAGLKTNKKLLLTNPVLREHKNMAKILIPKIRDLKIDHARALVRQKVEDINSGYIEPTTDSYIYAGKPASEREVIPVNAEKKSSDLPAGLDLDIAVACNKLIFLLTGRAISRRETGYTKEIIDKNRERGYKIVKSLDGDLRQLDALYRNLSNTKYTVTQILELLGKEIDVAQRKRELSKE